MQKLYTNVNLLANPTDGKHLVNKEYVDAAVSRKIKDAVVAVETSNVDAAYDPAAMTLTQNNPAAFVFDGVTLKEGDRVLLAGQTDAAQNGIYTVTTLGVDGAAAGVLTRADDFNDSGKIILNVMIPVQQGTENEDVTWVLTNDAAVTLDETALTFAKLKGAQSVNAYHTTITGDGAAKEFTINHGLNTENVVVRAADSATKETCLFDVAVTSANAVTLKSDIVLDTTDSFDVIVVG